MCSSDLHVLLDSEESVQLQNLDGLFQVDNNLKLNTMAEQIKTLQDFLKEYPNDKAEAAKQYLIYTNRFGGQFKN
mgnify:CR=1 FL=1